MARRVKKKGSKVKAKPLPLEIDRQEYIDLLYACKHLRHRVAIMLGWESGLRISEITALEKKDIHIAPNPKDSYIRVNCGKNSKDRIVSLPVSWQKHHINNIPLPCKQRAIQKAIIAAAEITGLKDKKPKVHFHSTRHGFATECIRKKININHVQKLMGHEDVQTTSIYINLAPQEALDDYYQRFGR